MRIEIAIWLIRQLDPRGLGRKLKYLAVAVTALGTLWIRAVHKADAAIASREASHLRRAQQAHERLAAREASTSTSTSTSTSARRVP